MSILKHAQALIVNGPNSPWLILPMLLVLVLLVIKRFYAKVRFFLGKMSARFDLTR
jgi:hypothetical protein